MWWNGETADDHRAGHGGVVQAWEMLLG